MTLRIQRLGRRSFFWFDSLSGAPWKNFCKPLYPINAKATKSQRHGFFSKPSLFAFRVLALCLKRSMGIPSRNVRRDEGPQRLSSEYLHGAMRCSNGKKTCREKLKGNAKTVRCVRRKEFRKVFASRLSSRLCVDITRFHGCFLSSRGSRAQQR